MTPGARAAAAIEILDRILAGQPAEQALVRWARGARYAGSGDRAAVRDHVFDAVRRKRSLAHIAGRDDGRGLIVGLAHADSWPLEAVFSGDGYAPPSLGAAERAPADLGTADAAISADMPDWLWPRLTDHYGPAATEIAAALQRRAPVWLRVNTLKTTRDAVARALGVEGIATEPGTLSPTALAVTDGARRLRNSPVLAQGLAEFQDAASQAVVDTLPLPEAGQILDYCAGGGGKALSLAARTGGAEILCHDANPGRMSDIPERATRAGACLKIVAPEDLPATAPLPLILCDVPCSGSGAWARTPDAKWRLTETRLAELRTLQAQILDAAAALTAPGGVLAYATCSVLAEENAAQATAFVQRHPGWRLDFDRQFLPGEGGDGFYVAHLRAP
ncbi:MAG: RsmB/NOP family class I SAM-dependent RNA methyltransferase [Pseudomonadota bacterium]